MKNPYGEPCDPFCQSSVGAFVAYAIADHVPKSGSSATFESIPMPCRSLVMIWFDATQQRWGWGFLLTPWMLTKLAGVLFLTIWHHYLLVAQKRFAAGVMLRSERFWRATNELPFLAAIVMVLAITTKFAF